MPEAEHPAPESETIAPTPEVEAPIDELLRLYEEERPHLNVFLTHIQEVIASTAPKEFADAVYMVRPRLKDPTHIAGKLERKRKRGIVVTAKNFFSEFEDLAGLRILTLYRWNFAPVHRFVSKNNYWHVVDEPEAYAVFPEDKQQFEEIGLKSSEPKGETPYTSIHYTVAPSGKEFPRCEIQVRGLHLEGWGEVDHKLRYPDKNPGKLACDLLLVLHQAAAVTDWLAHLAGIAAETEAKQAAEKQTLLDTLTRLKGEMEELRRSYRSTARDNAKLEKANAAAEETIADLRSQVDRSTSYPGLGATGIMNTLFAETCAFCNRPAPTVGFPPGRTCANCHRRFCSNCAAEPSFGITISASAFSISASPLHFAGQKYPVAQLCKNCKAFAE